MHLAVATPLRRLFLLSSLLAVPLAPAIARAQQQSDAPRAGSAREEARQSLDRAEQRRAEFLRRQADKPATEKAFPVTVEDLRAIQDAVQATVAKILPSTVSVQLGNSQGSGVIISEDGFVLTAGHVIGRPGREVSITLHDGKSVKGVTLGVDRDDDSGLVKITESGPWPAVEMADAEDIFPGQWCVSAGHPGGLIDGRGAVVRLGRVLFKNDEVVCTDCALVGGDSGGPLFNLQGKVIGIHSRIGSRLTDNFHVPIQSYKADWDRLVAGEFMGGRRNVGTEVEGQPWLGVTGNPSEDSCRLTQVFPDTPADRAGLHVGDEILTFDGEAVSNFDHMAQLIQQRKPRDRVTLEIRRGSERISIEVRLGRQFRPYPGGPPDRDEFDEGDDFHEE
ncbi:MAG: trypsin-like peptidase domain-containing protein [Pirellulales bacterium]